MHGGSILGNGNGGVDQPGLAFFLTVRMDFEDRNFHNPIVCDVDTRGFEVKKTNWPVEVEFHFWSIFGKDREIN